MRFTAIALAVAAVVLLSVPAWAHHSHVNYNTTEFTTVSGTITEVVWTNPHVWIYMDVTDAQGRPRMWAMEGGSVTSLMRGGWQRNSIKPGDKISVRCNRLRDGSEGCLLGFVTSINGTAMDKEFDGTVAHQSCREAIKELITSRPVHHVTFDFLLPRMNI